MPTIDPLLAGVTALYAEATARATQEREAFEASPQGELARAASNLRVTEAAMPADVWRELHPGAEAQPKVTDLPLREKAEVLAIQLGQLEKGTE